MQNNQTKKSTQTTNSKNKTNSLAQLQSRLPHLLGSQPINIGAPPPKNLFPYTIVPHELFRYRNSTTWKENSAFLFGWVVIVVGGGDGMFGLRGGRRV
jgi:hypothetical protein